MAGIDANCKLCLHCNGVDASTSFPDDSSSAHTVTAHGDAQVDTDQSKFGGASALFDGTGDYLTVPHHTDFVFGAGDFCIEFWVRAGAVGGGSNGCLCTKGGENNTGGEWVWLVAQASGSYNLVFYAAATNPWDFVSGVTIGTLTQNVWSHVAVCRNGTNLECYLDGTRGSITDVGTTALKATTTTVTFGGINAGGTVLTGHIDEVRISNTGRYTGASFSVPTEEFSAPAVLRYSRICA